MDQLPMKLAENSFLSYFGGEDFFVPNVKEKRFAPKALQRLLEQYIEDHETPDVYDQDGNTLILMGETGCGKSTQVPQIIYRHMQRKFPTAGRIRIAVTEPRRLAAITLAARVKEEMKSEVPGEVAHSVRFDTTFDKEATRVLFLTEGILVQKIMSDPYLRDYQVIVVDEAHERSINTEIILAHLRRLVYYRNKLAQEVGREMFKLKVVIMTATGEASSFREFFPGSKVVYIEGRMHSVRIKYLVPVLRSDYLSVTTALVTKLHQELPVDEHFLVFLTGQEEIEGVCRQLQATHAHFPVFTCPLYAALPKKAQDRAFQIPASGIRKVVVATNIAETSLTIPGIKVVIDSGFIKSKLYLSSHGVEAYHIQRISKSQAIQRAGRAGRECPGKVYRLYSRAEMENFQEFEEPEIDRSNLTQLMLMLEPLSRLDSTSGDFMTQLKDEVVDDANLELEALDLIQGEDKHLSDLAKLLYKFPLQPRLAAVLWASVSKGILGPVCAVISLVEAENLFVTDNDPVKPMFTKFWAPEGDLISYLIITRQFDKSKHSKLWCEKNKLSYRSLMYAAKVANQLENLMQGYIERLRVKYTPNVSSSSHINAAIIQCFGQVIHWQRAHLDKTGKYYIVDNIPKKKNTVVIQNNAATLRRSSQPMHAKIHPSSSLCQSKPTEIFFLDITLNEKNDLFLHHCVVYDKKFDLEGQSPSAILG